VVGRLDDAECALVPQHARPELPQDAPARAARGRGRTR
jgi:hypothetical protein